MSIKEQIEECFKGTKITKNTIQSITQLPFVKAMEDGLTDEQLGKVLQDLKLPIIFNNIKELDNTFNIIRKVLTEIEVKE